MSFARRANRFKLKAQVQAVVMNVLFNTNPQEVPVFAATLRAGGVFSVLSVLLFYRSKPIKAIISDLVQVMTLW